MPKKVLISLILFTLFVLPLFVRSQETLPWGQGVTQPTITLPTVPLESAVVRVANIIFYILALIAFIMVVWGGVVLATAGGDPSKVDLARHMIMYALIAIAVGAVAWGLVNMVASYVARVEEQEEQEEACKLPQLPHNDTNNNIKPA